MQIIWIRRNKMTTGKKSKIDSAFESAFIDAKFEKFIYFKREINRKALNEMEETKTCRDLRNEKFLSFCSQKIFGGGKLKCKLLKGKCRREGET